MSVLDLGDHGRGGADDAADDLLQFLAAQRVEIHAGLLGGGDECRILERLVERLPQRLDPIGRHVRRGEDRAADRDVAGDHVEDLPLLVVLRELAPAAARRGRAPCAGRPGSRMLTLLSLIQAGLLAFSEAQESLPRPSDLAALDGDVDVAAAGIAGNDLELACRTGCSTTCGYSTDGELAPVAPSTTRRFLASSMVRMPLAAHTKVMLLTTTMLPIQLNLRTSNWMPGWPERLVGRRGLAQHGDDGAVLGRDVVEPVAGAAAAGARHVLRRSRRACRECARR